MRGYREHEKKSLKYPKGAGPQSTKVYNIFYTHTQKDAECSALSGFFNSSWPRGVGVRYRHVNYFYYFFFRTFSPSLRILKWL